MLPIAVEIETLYYKSLVLLINNEKMHYYR